MVRISIFQPRKTSYCLTGAATVVGRGVLLIGRGLDGRADGWDIREEGDGEGFGGTRALFVPRNIRKMLKILL